MPERFLCINVLFFHIISLGYNLKVKMQKSEKAAYKSVKNINGTKRRKKEHESYRDSEED